MRSSQSTNGPTRSRRAPACAPTKVRGRLADAPVQRSRPRATERVGESDLRLAQGDPEAGQVERTEEG